MLGNPHNEVNTSNSTMPEISPITVSLPNQTSPPAPISKTSSEDTNFTRVYINLSQQPPAKEDVPNYDYGFREPFLPYTNWLTPEEATWRFNFPALGRLRFVKDPLGIIAMTMIISYWFFNVVIHVLHLLVPAYYKGYSHIGLIIAYISVGLLTLASVFRVSTKNPGALEVFSSSDASWTTCQKCQQLRPPEAHHCRRCGQCVRKMDHHCPWLNNCIGEDNRYLFLLVLVYASVMALMTCIFDFVVFSNLFPCFECHERSYVIVSMNTALKVSLINSFLLCTGGLGLLFSQYMSILFELPTMELTRIQIDLVFNGIYPKSMPNVRENVWGGFVDIFGMGWWGWWLLPCRKRRKINRKEDGFLV